MKPRSLLKASLSAVLLAAYAAAPPVWAAAASSPQTITRETASALLTQALKHQQDGAFEAAIRAYGEALKGPISDKTRITAMYNRALAYHQAGQPAMAIHDFSAALLLNPELAHAYYGRANALREAGRYASAIADYQKAAYYRYPHGHLPRFGQALTYELLNRPLSAEKLLQETLQIKPDFEPARRKLAELRSVANSAALSEAERARISVAVSVQSVYGSMTDRIDEIVTGSFEPVRADQIVRKAALPKPVRPPSHLLDAAEQVEVATLQLPGASRLSFSQTPASVSPAFVVAEKTTVPKIQDRVPEEPERVVTVPAVKIEPVSAPVEFTTRAMEQAQIEPAVPSSEQPKIEGYLVQINSQRNEAAAWAAWDKLQNKHPRLLKGREAIVQKTDLGAKGIVYRLRIHALASKGEAASLCQKLKAAGLSCFVALAGA
ncbi:MAG TPA: tetratricopeptide repeat protein [Aestuariivirgaceae bacterium]|jgi:Tfp pilus assembly protein PilF